MSLAAAARLHGHLRIGLEDDGAVVVKEEDGERVHLAGHAAGGGDAAPLLLALQLLQLLLLLLECQDAEHCGMVGG